MLKDVLFRKVMESIAQSLYGWDKTKIRKTYGGKLNRDVGKLQNVTFNAECSVSDDMLAFLMFNAEYVVCGSSWFRVDEDGKLTVLLDPSNVGPHNIRDKPYLLNDFWCSTETALLRSKHIFHEILVCSNCNLPGFTKEAVRYRLAENVSFSEWKPTPSQEEEARQRIHNSPYHKGHSVHENTTEDEAWGDSSQATLASDGEYDSGLNPPLSVILIQDDRIITNDEELDDNNSSGLNPPPSGILSQDDRVITNDEELDDNNSSGLNPPPSVILSQDDRIITNDEELDDNNSSGEDKSEDGKGFSRELEGDKYEDDDDDDTDVQPIAGESSGDILLMSGLNCNEQTLYRLLMDEPNVNGAEYCSLLSQKRVAAMSTSSPEGDARQSYRAALLAAKKLVSDISSKLTDTLEDLNRNLLPQAVQWWESLKEGCGTRRTGSIKSNLNNDEVLDDFIKVMLFVLLLYLVPMLSLHLTRNIG
jgi:hypothetical protein